MSAISVEEAREIVLSSVERMGSERLHIMDSLGRVLAEEIVSRLNLPPFDNSAMDGFALRADDIKSASHEDPVSLQIIEELSAGVLPSAKVEFGTAIRIMTGAPLPKGADSVLRVEDSREEAGRVFVLKPIERGENIRREGEDIRKGQTVLSIGGELNPGAIAMLASLGQSSVMVTQRPLVGVLSTGDELVDIGEYAKEGKVVASNLYALAAQILQAGATPLVLGIVSDEPELIEAKLHEAMRCDVILTTGGVSVGSHDYVKDILYRLRYEPKLWRVRMRPGYPLLFGDICGKAIFGLPGNPISAMVCFEQFVRPALRKMMGHQRLYRPRLQARLREALRQKPGRKSFLRARLVREDGDYSVTIVGNQSSGAMLSMARANSLLVFPADRDEFAEGELVEVEVIDEGFWQEERRSREPNAHKAHRGQGASGDQRR